MHVREVTSQQVVHIPFLQAIHREGEVVHERKLVVARPNQVQAVDESVDCGDCVANVAFWQFIQQFVQVSVKIFIEESLRSVYEGV